MEELCENYRNRAWWRGRVNTRINSPVQKLVRPPSEAVDVPNSDWDVLIVIDAARYDLFEERTVSLDYDFEERRVRSKASATREWLDQNFNDEYGDTVYVTANPQVSKYKPDKFHRLIEVWRDGFNEEHQTILPRTVTDAAIEAHKEYPNKRLVVHYVQPHEPFVGHPELNFSNWDDVLRARSGLDTSNDAEFSGTAFGAVYNGAAKKSEVWEAYRENLDYVLMDINRLLDGLEGKVVLTSDHGNTFPRLSWPIPVRVWSHPSGLRLRELISVPWLEATLSARPDIVDEGATPAKEYEGEDLERTLAHLGYR